MTNQTPQLENGYTRIAHEILDNLIAINLSSYQTRVILLILRKTYGYGKKEDWISVSQIVKATGIKKSHASRTKKELLLRKLVTSNGNKIAFQKDSRLWCELPKQVTNKKSYQFRPEVTNSGQKVTNSGQKLPVQGHTIDNIQKIITIDTITIDILNEISEKYKVPQSFVESKLDDLRTYCLATGKKYKDYKAALSSWVKKDAIKILQKDYASRSKYSLTIAPKSK